MSLLAKITGMLLLVIGILIMGTGIIISLGLGLFSSGIKIGNTPNIITGLLTTWSLAIGGVVFIQGLLMSAGGVLLSVFANISNTLESLLDVTATNQNYLKAIYSLHKKPILNNDQSKVKRE